VTDGPTLDRPALMLLFGTVEHGPVRPSALADSLYIDLSTVSRQLAALESSGWVARERDPDDRRAFLVRATDEGQRVLAANLAARRALLKDLLTDWSEDERLEFARLLGLLNKTLEQRNGGSCLPARAGQETT
jgi:DNA-binding MarR family transcriptional regulator